MPSTVSFTQPPGSPFPVGSTPFGVAVGDFDHDGNLDLAVANVNSNNVSVLLGNGDGTFGAATNFATGAGPYGVAIGDFNNDGNLDLAVVNNTSNNVSILLGNGTGSFAGPISISVGSQPIYVAVGDFNGDGRLDLAVTDGGTPHTISILLGNGDGTFQSAVNIAMDGYVAGLAVGDFNHDGKSDLVVANISDDAVSVLLGQGNGTFGTATNYPAGSQPNVVTLGDFNGDGNLDLAVSRRNPDSLSVLLGKGDGSFGAPQQFPTGNTPRGVAAADFNGDGKLDLVVADQDDNNVSVLLGNGDGTFGPPTNFGVGTHPYEVAVADFNHDGAPDVAIGNLASNNVTILLNRTLPAPSSLLGFVFEDFNNDGLIDFGEQGIQGVGIRLQGTDDLGEAIDATTTTDSNGLYQFGQLRPGSYTITETQPAGYTQGINSVGTVGGSVSGDQFSVQLDAGVDGMNYNFGERPATSGEVQHGQIAGIGFWNNRNGQALIKSLNAGANDTQLGNWLTATFVNIFGADAGTNDLTGKTNTQVAAVFQQKFVLRGQKLDAQLMATALSVYVTNQTLAGTVATAYGFSVTHDGVGAATFNVGSDGAAVGQANGTVLSIMDILLATDRLSAGSNGLLYSGDATLRNKANDLYSAINQEGNIG